MKPRRFWSSKHTLLVLFGAAGCGTPAFGSGGDGSGSSGEFGDHPDRWVTDGSSDDGEEIDPTRGGGGGGGSSADDGDTDGDEDDSGTAPTPDGGPTGLPTTSCACGDADDFPNVWLAEEGGAVRKLDADTMNTRGVYYTGPTGTAGRAASVAVSIDGDAIAVSNEYGGVVKIWARPELCDAEQNGLAGLQTTTGDHALPWGTEECVAWEQPTNFTTQIPVAWGPGAQNPGSCEYEHQVVWTAGCNEGSDAMSSALRIDGDTGEITHTVPLSGFACGSHTPTLGAVDREGSFWIASSVPGESRLARISNVGTVMTFESTPMRPAGIAVDSTGHVWLSSRYGSAQTTAARYTPSTGTWDLAIDSVLQGSSGIVEDDEGRMWLNYESFTPSQTVPGGSFVRGDTMQVGPAITQPCATGSCEGISIDFAGRIWTTSRDDERVVRFDPHTGDVDTLGGMDVTAFSSDNTGWALQNAACAGI